MPSLGADMEAGTLVEWKVKPGDEVKRGAIVAVVETQKGAIDVEVFESGRVRALLVEPGTAVPVGTVLARIDGAGEETPVEQGASSQPAAPAAVPAATASRLASAASASAGARPPAAPRASPGARLRARELGVDLAKVRGTGPGGAVTRDDVERSAAAATPSRAAPAPAARPAMRQAIAAAMARSKREIPHYYLATTIDMSRALDWLSVHNAAKRPAERLLPLVLLLEAVARAARRVPEMNGYYEQGAFRPAAAVHVGVVVALREGGLLVPALHDVDQKPREVLGRELSDVIERARRGQLKSSELSDATLTVTSLGERGVEQVFGVIFPPQVALVGFGKIVESAAVVEGQCVPRRSVTATLAADHRVSDGHRGALFLSQIGASLQNPEAP